MCYMTGTVLSVLQTLFHLVPTIFLQSSCYLHLQKTMLPFLFFLPFLIITVTLQVILSRKATERGFRHQYKYLAPKSVLSHQAMLRV